MNTCTHKPTQEIYIHIVKYNNMQYLTLLTTDFVGLSVTSERPEAK